MTGQSTKWIILVATIWIQAFTGTNFDFSSYSNTMKSVLGISQVQLNYLSVASDMGKVFGWCSGVSVLYFPLWVVMFMAAFLGLLGYGLQWLVIQQLISLPYFVVFLLCLIAGCSICWFNTVCYVLCIRNFPSNRSLALSLTISFNGVSAALYALIANAINSDNDTLYLILNAVIPLLVSCIAFFLILNQPPLEQLSTDDIRRDSFVFLILNVLAVVTGLYLLLLNSLSSVAWQARLLLAGAIILLILPLPGIFYVRNWTSIISRFSNGSSFNLIGTDELEAFKGLIEVDDGNTLLGSSHELLDKKGCFGCFDCADALGGNNRIRMIGEEHTAGMLVRKYDFWLYYIAYFCGGTIGLVYSNNLGQIAQSLGFYSKLDSFITLYSSCSFFGRLLSAGPDFLRGKAYFARTGWLALALLLTPIAFFLLVASGNEATLRASTAMIGLSSGFVVSAAVSVTSELFGPNSAGVNHNILITNIPLGSLLYGLLAAIIYDGNASSSDEFTKSTVGEMVVCMGRKCYLDTFITWGCISSAGLILMTSKTQASPILSLLSATNASHPPYSLLALVREPSYHIFHSLPTKATVAGTLRSGSFAWILDGNI